MRWHLLNEDDLKQPTLDVERRERRKKKEQELIKKENFFFLSLL
jgi:hypothetical protein